MQDLGGGSARLHSNLCPGLRPIGVALSPGVNSGQNRVPGAYSPTCANMESIVGGVPLVDAIVEPRTGVHDHSGAGPI